MCGFFGVHRPAGGGDARRIDPAWLERRLDALAHRGPDGRGTFREGPSGLAAARLAIQGDHRADPPLRSRDGRIVLALNGEILDRTPLARLVAAAGHEVPAPAAGDGPLLAEAVAALASRPGGIQGPLLGALLEGGMGALAAIDRRTGDLWLARDRLGIKPLFALEAEGAFLYASEIRPLLEAVPAARRADPDGLAELLHLQRPAALLPFRGVGRLAPGAVWRVSAGGRVSRWTGGQGIRDLVDREALRIGEAVRGLEEALLGAARLAAGEGPPPALFLSGGLDSGAVAVLLPSAPARAWTGRFAPAGGALDESERAGRVAAHAGIRHEVVDLEDGDLLADLPAVVAALGVPMAGPGALALWRLARRAGEDGRVVLTGTGGDELLAGYARTALVLGRGGPGRRGTRASPGGSTPRATTSGDAGGARSTAPRTSRRS